MSATTPTSTLATVPPAAPRRRRRRTYGVSWWTTALAVVLSLTVLVPLYFTVVTAFKTPEELDASGFSLPRSWNLDNFREAWTTTTYPRRILTHA